MATVERNGIIRIESTAIRTRATTEPTDLGYIQQAWHYDMIDAAEAWDITTGSPSVLVAVVDDGIRFDHPGIAPNLTNDGYDFVPALDFFLLCGGGALQSSGDGDGPDANPTPPSLSEALEMVGEARTACEWLGGANDKLLSTTREEHIASLGGQESIGTALVRVTLHTWFHIGEINAMRQMLGHGEIPFVGQLIGNLEWRSS